MIGNHGIFSTHDTGNAYWFFRITDHQYIFIQLTFLSVQRHKFFTCCCTADNDLFSFDRIQIIGVHRLSVFFHHIIRNIYKIIDRTDSMCTETFLHPLRRWGKLNILYNSCRVTAAKILILYRYFDVIIDIFVISGFCYDRRYKFLMERGCCLTRNAEYGKTVYTVGCNLIFDNAVIQS